MQNWRSRMAIARNTRLMARNGKRSLALTEWQMRLSLSTPWTALLFNVIFWRKFLRVSNGY
jgi:hypothetical protein